MEADRPDGVHQYSQLNEVPYHLHKYWHQRHKIFSKFEEGIWLTDDAWFEVTPEPIATQIAQDVARTAPEEKRTLVDAFAGVGGNVIAFALSGRWDKIFAIERDPVALKCAKHNAEVYGVQNQIFWIEGDCFSVIRKRFKSLALETIVFASPPWGGPGYSSSAVFDLETMQPYPFQQLMELRISPATDLILYLPRTSDLNQIARKVSAGDKIPVIHYCISKASKALCVYIGRFQFE